MRPMEEAYPLRPYSKPIWYMYNPGTSCGSGASGGTGVDVGTAVYFSMTPEPRIARLLIPSSPPPQVQGTHPKAAY